MCIPVNFLSWFDFCFVYFLLGQKWRLLPELKKQKYAQRVQQERAALAQKAKPKIRVSESCSFLFYVLKFYIWFYYYIIEFCKHWRTYHYFFSYTWFLLLLYFFNTHNLRFVREIQKVCEGDASSRSKFLFICNRLSLMGIFLL